MPTTPNMSLVLPTVSSTVGPDWAQQLNAAFSLIDSHDHSSGEGVPITPAGINISSNLAFNDFYLTSVGSLRLTNQAATLATPSDVRALYAVNGDLYFNNSAGAAVQITSGGSVIAASDGIARSFSRVSVASNTIISAAATVSYYDVDTATGVTFTLPAANAVSAGRFYEFKDTTGQAATNNIVINRAGADTIDGATSVTVDQPYGAVRLISNGSNKWAVAPHSLLPAGSILPYAGSTSPFGFLFCFGQAISRTVYSGLFSVVGTTYGVGDGSTTFNLPDLRGRVAVGRDDMGGSAANRITTGGSGINGANLGAAGGTQTHTLVSAEMPSHTHTQNAHFHRMGFDNNATTVSTYGFDTVGSVTGVQSATGSTRRSYSESVTATNQNTGGDGAHQNTQPSIILNYIIRY